MAEKKVNYTCTCTTKENNLNIRALPNITSTIISKIKTGTKGIKVTKVDGSWYYIPANKGWGNTKYLKRTDTKVNDKTEDVKDNQEAGGGNDKSDKPDKKYTPPKGNDYQNVINYYSWDKTNLDKLLIHNLAGIHGMPYQFHQNVDIRLKRNTDDPELQFGRKYAEKIVTTMPLLLLTPGRPEFLPGYKKNDKTNMIGALMQSASVIKSNYKNQIQSMLKSEGRYYSFKFAYSEYYDFVEPMLRICSQYLNLQATKVNIGGYSAKLGDFEWRKAVNDSFKNYISQQEFVPFYVDSQNQISESISNATTSSQLGSAVNSLSDIANEVQFLLGGYAGKEMKILNQSAYDATLSNIEGIANEYLNGSKLFQKIGETMSTVASGGKIYFPEIWQDSEYTKSYDISIKLRTPDGDRLSWFLNICVPIIHILALAAPQQMGPNGYSAPFLVRGFYKGIFNCDMGIITNLDISKGKESAWTVDGLPTEVDINITLKDLYSVLTISKQKDLGKLLKNIALMDYLGNTCGLNVNKPELKRSIDLYLMLAKNKIIDAVTLTNVFNNANQGLANKLRKLYEDFVGR